MVLVKFILSFILLYCFCVFAQHPGDLDSTFGVNGFVTTNIQPGSPDGGKAVAIQTNGKIVVAGRTEDDFVVVRYNQDGTLDDSFDSNGIVTTDFLADDWANSIKIQNDEKLVVAGSSWSFYWMDIALARYNQDGSLDIDFGVGGKVRTNVSGGEGNAVAIQSDGKIVVAGYCCYPADITVVRYNTNGTLDDSFGIDGKVITDINTYEDYGFSVAIQSDDKIVVAGYSWNGFDRDFVVVRYKGDGSLDSSFGSNGIVTADFNGYHDEGRAVAIQTNGKIVVAGYSWESDISDFLVIRYNNDGTLDNTFGSGGIVTTDIDSAEDFCYDIAIQPDGKIVTVGVVFIPNFGWKFAIVRYNNNGIPDSSFGYQGRVTTTFGYSAICQAVAIQSDGKIVLTGLGNNDILLARYIGVVPPIQVQSPNGGEHWMMGDTEEISWDSNNVDSVKIELSLLGGQLWHTIEESTESDGVYEWIVQAPQSSWECKIHITDLTDSTITDSSDGTFVIDIFPSVDDSTGISVPQEYSLYQNYPNPFNPSTIIKYQIPERGMVTIRVYDVLGNEIATLVNEEKPAGEYNIEFRIDNLELSSGIYFYQLKAGSFIQTKKMIVLK